MSLDYDDDEVRQTPNEWAKEALADHERINFLETLNARKAYTGLVACRDSLRGGGWRLHETSEVSRRYTGVTPKPTVREAIDDAMRRANQSGLDALKGD